MFHNNGMKLTVFFSILENVINICSGCAGPAQDLGDPVSVTGHSGEQLQLLCFLGLTG